MTIIPYFPKNKKKYPCFDLFLLLILKLKLEHNLCYIRLMKLNMEKRIYKEIFNRL